MGAGVARVLPGDRVYTARTLSGAYAEYALALESQVHPLPARISFAQGAGLWVPYGTAFTALRHHAQARPGETLLVHGASGGVGLAAIQFARAMGLRVLGTAGTAEGLDLVLREGAHQAFDHTQPAHAEQILEATGGRGVDVVLEMLANVNLPADLRMLAMDGRVIIIGNRGETTLNPRDLMARRATAKGFTLWAATEAESAEMHAAIAAGLENSTLRPVVGKELPLGEAPRAHLDILAPGARGKIILVP